MYLCMNVPSWFFYLFVCVYVCLYVCMRVFVHLTLHLSIRMFELHLLMIDEGICHLPELSLHFIITKIIR